MGMSPKAGNAPADMELCMIDGYEHQHERFPHIEIGTSRGSFSVIGCPGIVEKVCDLSGENFWAIILFYKTIVFGFHEQSC